jgi:hypothetical protein
MLKVTVDRKWWLRGEGASGSALLRKSDGKMCCLGFAAKAAGCVNDEIEGLTSPVKVFNNEPSEFPAELDGLLYPGTTADGGEDVDEKVNSEVCCRLMGNNDDESMTEREREDAIKWEGVKIDIEFEFVG